MKIRRLKLYIHISFKLEKLKVNVFVFAAVLLFLVQHKKKSDCLILNMIFSLNLERN
jgi:hypothetical protein